MGLSFEHVRPDDVRKKVDMLQYEFNNAEANLRLFVEEYPQLEKIIELVTYNTKLITGRYLFLLDRYVSMVNNIHLYSEIEKEWDEYRHKGYEGNQSSITELTNKLRAILKSKV